MNLNLFLNTITTFTAIILPIYVMKETNKSNQKQLLLKVKIEKNSLLFSFLSKWYIEILKIHNSIGNKNSLDTKIIDNLFENISENIIYQNQCFKDKFFELMQNTSLLINSDLDKCDEYRNEAISAIKELQNMLNIKELN